MQQRMLEADKLESSFARKDLGILMDTKLNTSQQHVLAAQKAGGILRIIRGELLAGRGMRSFPSALVRPPRSLASDSGLPSTKVTQ